MFSYSSEIGTEMLYLNLLLPKAFCPLGNKTFLPLHCPFPSVPCYLLQKKSEPKHFFFGERMIPTCLRLMLLLNNIAHVKEKISFMALKRHFPCSSVLIAVPSTACAFFKMISTQSQEIFKARMF